MLAIMTQYERKLISLKTARAAFELIEKFTFQFNALTQSRGGGGVSNMYARLAQNAMACSGAQDFVQVLSDMRDKFQERLPDETEFAVPFSRIIYRASYTRERNLVRYVLTKLARHFGMPAEIDVALLSIEHILPQSKGDETGDEFDVGAIGNLILMNEALNGRLDDKSFKHKKNYLSKEHGVYADKMLLDADDWDEQAIAERGVSLAKLGYEKIWSI